MRAYALLSALLVAAYAAPNTNPPGVSASLSQAGLNYIVDVVVPALEAKLEGITIPPFSGEKDDFDYDLDNVKINYIAVNTSESGITATSTGLSVSFQGLAMSMTGDWSFKLHSWPHIPDGSGSVDASFSDSSMTFDLDVYAGPAGSIQLAMGDVTVTFGSWSIDPHGSAWDWLFDIIKDLFHNDIQNLIETQIKDLLAEFVNTDANAALMNFPMQIDLPFNAPLNTTALRFNLTSNATFQPGFVGVDLLGDFVDVANPVPAPFSPPKLPDFDPSASEHYIQMFLSAYTFETLIYSFYESGAVKFVVPHTVIPASFPVTLNTTWMALVAPNISKIYPNMWVDIAIEEIAVGSATMNESGITVSIPVGLAFQPITPTGPVDAFVLGCNLSASVDLLISENATLQTEVIHGNLSYLDCPLHLVNSSVGTVHYSLLSDLIDWVFPNFILPIANDLLNPGFPLPTNDGVNFTDSSITFGTDYAMFATDFTVNVSQASHAPQSNLPTHPQLSFLRGN